MKKTVLVAEALQATAIDRSPGLFVLPPTFSAPPLVKIVQEKRLINWPLLWGSLSTSFPRTQPPVAPPLVCHQCTPYVVLTPRVSRYGLTSNCSNVVAEGKRGLERDEGCRSSPSEKTRVGVKIEGEDFNGGPPLVCGVRVRMR
jgi:hypothetical protein